MTQPLQERVAIRRGEHGLEGVAALSWRDAFSHAQQMEVVVSENRGRRIAQRTHEAQATERIRTAVHEIADEPQPIPLAIETDFGEQLLQRFEAALQVPD